MTTYLLHVEPKAKTRPRFRRRGDFVQTYTDAKTVQAEASIRDALLAYAFTMHDAGVPLFVELLFVMARPKSVPKARLYPVVKPDLDNLAKLVKDACNTVLWHDDAQVVQLTAKKRYALPNEQPFIELKVEPL